MAKTIKFNLVCDGKSIRTLEDLRNNFSIEDVLSYYKDGLLERWLRVRGFNEELKQLETVDKNDKLSIIIKSLIKIFNIEADESDIKKIICILQYQKEKELQLKKYEENRSAADKVITDYFDGYFRLVNEIIENEDMTKIKAALEEIDKNYYALFELDFRRLFYVAFEANRKAVFAMLMRENMRVKYIPEDKESIEINRNISLDMSTSTGILRSIFQKKQNGVANPDTNSYLAINKDTMYDYISGECNGYIDDMQKILGDNLKVFSGSTDGEWKVIEPKGKKYMILKMYYGSSYIRPAGKSDIKLEEYDVTGHFPIIDGIEYCSYYRNETLLYLEV